MWATLLGILKVFGVVAAKALFIFSLPLSVAASLFGLPGTVLVITSATVYSALHQWQSPPWWVLLILLAIALLAEATENLMALTGIKNTGATTATGVWTMAGGFVGVIIGGGFAPLAGAVGLAAGPLGVIALTTLPPVALGLLGGFLGGYWCELRRGKSPEEAKRTGWGALLGRLSGSVLKAILVGIMAAIVLATSWPTLF